MFYSSFNYSIKDVITTALTDWTSVITNVLREQLSVAEAMVLLEIRWQAIK
jgi:hypothetical protein